MLPKAFTLALCRARTDWTSRVVTVCGCEGRTEWGDSANSPNAQRHTAAQIPTQAGNEKTGLNLSRGLNRDSVVSGGGVLSERAEGRQLARNG